MKKKVLSIALAATLVVGLCPGMALAADGGETTLGAASAQSIVAAQATDISSAKLESAFVWWSGKSNYVPDFTVKVGSKTLKKGTDYTVASYKYFGNKLKDGKLSSGTTVKGVSKGGYYSVVLSGKGSYSGSVEKPFIAGKLTVSSIANQQYTGSAIKPKLTVKWATGTTEFGAMSLPVSGYTASYKNNKSRGTATVTLKGKGVFAGAGNTATATFKIVKGENPMKIKTTNKVISLSKVKNRSQTVSVLSFSKKAVGALGYKNASSSQVSKYFSVNTKSGKVTAKKGTPKGSYSVKVKVTAKGDANFNSATKTVTAKVTVK